MKYDDHDSPCLYRFVQLIALETSKHYGPYAIAVIVKGSIDYLIGMVLEEQIGLMRDVRGTLVGTPLALDIFNEFMDGYIMFHCSHSRYRLREIGVVLGRKE